MPRTCLLLLISTLLLCAERPLGAESWAASFAKESAGDFTAALAVLQPLRQAHSDAYLIALRTGWLQYRSGRFEESVTAYQEASKLAPAAIEPRLGMITPMIAVKRWSEAERQARLVLRSDPGCFWASYWLTESLLGAERWREAGEVSRGLVERYPGDATVLEQAFRCGKVTGESANSENATRLAILKLGSAR